VTDLVGLWAYGVADTCVLVALRPVLGARRLAVEYVGCLCCAGRSMRFRDTGAQMAFVHICLQTRLMKSRLRGAGE